MRILVLALTIGMMATGCQTWRDRMANRNADQNRTETTAETAGTSGSGRVATELDAAVVRKLSFNEGSTDLSASAQEQIRKAISEAQASGRKIDDVKVVVWGDQSYPTKDSASLPREQVNLAKERGDRVSKFLKDDLSVSEVDVYNMTERPNTFERWFNTSDAKIKNSLERSGMVRNGSLVRNDRSQAYVMITLEDHK